MKHVFITVCTEGLWGVGLKSTLFKIKLYFRSSRLHYAADPHSAFLRIHGRCITYCGCKVRGNIFPL